MVKRAVGVFLALVLAFAGVGVRISDIGKNSMQAANSVSSLSVDIATLRGTVYDCNMIPLTNSENVLYVAAKPSNQALAQLKGSLDGEVFESVKQRMSKGKPIAVRADKIPEDSSDILPFTVPARYRRQPIACHVIGYLDSSGKGISGIEKSCDDLLSSASSAVRVRFAANADGGVLLGEDISVTGNDFPKSGVCLTLDKGIQLITEAALASSGFQKAAAVVIDIESGAIRACASRPEFNPNSVAESLHDEASPLINRAFLPFSVGSVFKPIVAAAALESGISENYEYNCTGSIVCNGVTFNCHKESGHGVLDLEKAVAYSCNTYFISLALETGAEKIVDTAKEFGFGEETVLADSVRSAGGYLPLPDELDSRAAIANLSFGQGSLIATPLQICSAVAAIARNGIYIRPYLIDGEVDENGSLIRISDYSERRQIISQANARRLRNYLEKVVEYGSGKRAMPDSVSVAGKTATAQTGKEKNGEEIYNAWFAGYFPADNPKYAVSIMVEDGGEGALSCAPIFRDIAEAMSLTKK